ncbi:MAG: cadmium-translocating P-type ATPase [Chloroflexi bacterium]|nr:cadmium-translocating P-type ATPase [Chloroflexota bacterium]
MVALDLKLPLSELFAETETRLTALSGLFFLAGVILSLASAPSWAQAGVYLAAIVVGGVPILREAWEALWEDRRLTIDSLVVVAVIGAVLLGQWWEAAAVVFLFSFSEMLEEFTLDRAHSAIQTLMELSPQEARIKVDGRESTVPVEDVAVGMIVAVRPGERVPVDGDVVAGESTIDQAAITGESAPVAKTSGDSVFAGTINQQGYLEIAATRPSTDNAIARIVRLVEEAQQEKAPTAQFIDRFAAYYTPGIVVLAFLVATVPWLAFEQPLEEWVYRGLVLLLVGCPCALVISTPISIVAAIARSARSGVLMKSGAVLELLGQAKVMAFDKTGTLTRGQPEVTDVIPAEGFSESDVIQMADRLEHRSEHQLAAAILRRAGHTDTEEDSGHVHTEEIQDFEAIAGRGVRARVDGTVYVCGSPDFLSSIGYDLVPYQETIAALQDAGKTALLVAQDKQIAGLIATMDTLRPEAEPTLHAINDMGISHMVMLTGDSQPTATAIAQQLPVRHVSAELLPWQKLVAIQDLVKAHGNVLMVGDGVNDAPALASATAGIALGGAGADVALETADVVLMGDDLSKIPTALQLSRRTMTVIKQNITFSLGIKLLVLVLTLFGLTYLWMAILADVGATILVAGNGLRLLRSSD